MLFQTDHVSVIRRGKPILDRISLSIDEGEFVTIIGPNGAGKTVLLHTLMGLVRPDRGSVTRKQGLRIGYVPQRLVPEPTMPVTVARFMGLVRGATAKAIHDSLTLTEAADMADKPLSVLSGGELQRVLLARAVLQDPDILILDEPAQNLDIGGQLSFYRTLESIYRDRGCAVLMVSHDLHMVLASTSRVICLFHHVCCSGTPDVIARDPQFEALFGHDMAKMMTVYHHIHTHNHEHDHDH